MSDTGICPHCGKDFMHDAQNTVCPHCQGKVYPNVRALIKDYDEQALYGVGLLCDEDCVITDGSRMRVKFCWDENDPSYDGDITKYCENHLAQRYVNGQVVSTMDTSAYVVNYYGIARRRVVAPDGHMLGSFSRKAINLIRSKKSAPKSSRRSVMPRIRRSGKPPAYAVTAAASSECSVKRARHVAKRIRREQRKGGYIWACLA